MRISTASFFERNAQGMSELQQKLFKTQQKLGAGTKFLTPSDDPVSAARTLAVTESMAEAAHHANSRSRATQSLQMEENALQQGASVLQDVKTLIVQAGDGTLSDADRATIGTALQGQLDELVGVANSDDGNGQYLFAGFQGGRPPFLRDAAGNVAYGGDTGQRLAQVDVARQIAATDDGRSVFLSVQGSAKCVTTAAAGNKGAGVFSGATVSDGRDYTVTFQGVTLQGNNQYQVSDGATKWLVTAQADGQIAAGGLTMRVAGQPQAGDQFTVQQAQNAACDLFAAMKDVIAALKAPASVDPAAESARVLNALSTANVKITNAHDNILTVRSSVGSRLAELETLDASGETQKLANQTYLSELQDLDYAGAISEFTQRQTNLQATQQTFARLQSVNLFSYLS